MFNPFNLLSTVTSVIFKLQIWQGPQALSLHSPTLKPISGFPLLSLLFQRQIILHLILRTPAFFLLLEYASKYLWNGLTNTWNIISVEFSEALVNHIRIRMQHWFWTGRLSMLRGPRGRDWVESSWVLCFWLEPTQSALHLSPASHLLGSKNSHQKEELQACELRSGHSLRTTGSW